MSHTFKLLQRKGRKKEREIKEEKRGVEVLFAMYWDILPSGTTENLHHSDVHMRLSVSSSANCSHFTRGRHEEWHFQRQASLRIGDFFMLHGLWKHRFFIVHVFIFWPSEIWSISRSRSFLIENCKKWKCTFQPPQLGEMLTSSWPTFLKKPDMILHVKKLKHLTKTILTSIMVVWRYMMLHTSHAQNMPFRKQNLRLDWRHLAYFHFEVLSQLNPNFLRNTSRK